jgi:serine/threonine protein kinase
MPTSLELGVILHKRYKIVRIIGQGGMGCIYLAEDNRLKGRSCAIKEVEYDRSFGKELIQESREQFNKEATVLARLDHPNLPKVSDYFSIKMRDYLVMDFVPGEDLRTLISKAKQNKRFLKNNDVLNWIRQLADALIYLHNQEPPILHRDIKPSNLKITPNGVLKLVDFGLVKLLSPGEGTITIIQGHGTAFYTPLEQYGGDSTHTDVRSDIYAFGATLYHLMTNTPPIDARARFLNPESYINPRQINPAINLQIEKAINLAMNLHPDQRPQSVQLFKEYLFGREIEISKKSEIIQVLWDQFKKPNERNLLWVSIGLTIITLFIVLMR